MDGEVFGRECGDTEEYRGAAEAEDHPQGIGNQELTTLGDFGFRISDFSARGTVE